jgi:hypothetical protein
MLKECFVIQILPVENDWERMIYQYLEQGTDQTGGKRVSLEVDFENKDGFVHVLVSGIFTKESALTVFEKMLVYCTVTQNSKILIDCRRIEGDIPTEEILGFSQQSDVVKDDYDDMGQIGMMKLAYLFDPSHHNIDQIKDGVNDPNRNDFIISTDHGEAVDWLNSL